MTRYFTIALLISFAVGCQSDQSDLFTREQITAPVWVGEPYPADSTINPRTFEIDLDHDGVAEVFVEQPLTRGNAGVTHSIFRRHGDRYEYLGELFFHPAAFRVLEPTDDYPVRVMKYHRSSSNEGTVGTFGYADGEFILLDTEVIHPGDGGTDEGRARYAELFGD